ADAAALAPVSAAALPSPAPDSSPDPPSLAKPPIPPMPPAAPAAPAAAPRDGATPAPAGAQLVHQCTTAISRSIIPPPPEAKNPRTAQSQAGHAPDASIGVVRPLARALTMSRGATGAATLRDRTT